MRYAYPGELERARCAARTRQELIQYQPHRPLGFRDALRLEGMAARCGFCGACPATIRAIGVMAPQKPEPASALILKMAG